MRKYVQITFVLGVFAALVVLRQLKGNDMPVVVGSQNANNQVATPTSIPTSIPSNTPTPASSSSSANPPAPTATPTSAPTPKPRGQYKDGSYTGSVQDAFYGNIQVQAIISNGKITVVNFLQYPNDNRTSQYVNSQADPMLAQEAIQKQSAQVDIVSGASASSQAFQASLADALSQAK
jgi:uncharacterized protein with FMN-binding domain